MGLGLRQKLSVEHPRLENPLLFVFGESLVPYDVHGNPKIVRRVSHSCVEILAWTDHLCGQLEAQCQDGPVVVFWPHVDDVSEASPPVCHTCGCIYVYPGVRESHVNLSQGSELIIALDQ